VQIDSETKASRWAARATGLKTPAVPAAVSSTVATDPVQESSQTPPATAKQCVILAAAKAAGKLVQGHREALVFPAPEIVAHGSAMAAWMERAAAKTLHLPWREKFRDYADENKKLASGLTKEEIRRQRQHLNVPELARSYSSTEGSDGKSIVSGLGWARSCLDSKAAWRPNNPDVSQWMEMDLGQEMEIIGLVTQGQAATGCSGTLGKCDEKCPPPHACNGGGEKNYVTRVRVKYRSLLSETLTILSEDMAIGKGGDARCETLFPAPVRARYVRIFPVDYHVMVGMRAGILLQPSDHLFESSPFSVKTLESKGVGAINSAEKGAHHAADASSIPAAVGMAVPMSKAQRCAARSMPPSTAATTTVLASASSFAVSSATSKAGRWAARAAEATFLPVVPVASDPLPAAASVQSLASSPCRLAAAGMSKAQKWAARAAAAAPHLGAVSQPEATQPVLTQPATTTAPAAAGQPPGNFLVLQQREQAHAHLTGSVLQAVPPVSNATRETNHAKGAVGKVKALAPNPDTFLSFKDKMRQQLQQLEEAAPVSVRWLTPDESTMPNGNTQAKRLLRQAVAAGIKIPVVERKDTLFGAVPDAVVWQVTGEVPFVVCYTLSNGDYPFLLQAQYVEGNSEVMLCSKMGGQYGDRAATAQYAGTAKTIRVTISIDHLGYHLTVAPHTHATLFYPHLVSLDVLPMAKLTQLALRQLVSGNTEPPNVSIKRLPQAEAIMLHQSYQYRSEDWTLVFRQTAPFVFSPADNWAEARLLHADNPHAPNFSTLGRLDESRCASDGHFSLMLHYPEREDKRNIWRQSSNPVTMREQGVEHYQAISIDFDEAYWRGLQKTDGSLKPAAASFLDGSCEHYEYVCFYSKYIHTYAYTHAHTNLPFFIPMKGMCTLTRIVLSRCSIVCASTRSECSCSSAVAVLSVARVSVLQYS